MLPMSFTGGECSLESTQEDVPAADQLGLQHSQTLDCTQDKVRSGQSDVLVCATELLVSGQKVV